MLETLPFRWSRSSRFRVGDDVIRLNFSNTDPERCDEGIARLSRAIANLA